jgi:GTP-binding protein
MDLIETTPFFPMEESKEESVMYRYVKPEDEIKVFNLGNGKWRVSGGKVQSIMMRSKTDTESDVFRLGNNLRKIGVDKALREAGAVDGDQIFILDFSFEFVE